MKNLTESEFDAMSWKKGMKFRTQEGNVIPIKQIDYDDRCVTHNEEINWYYLDEFELIPEIEQETQPKNEVKLEVGDWIGDEEYKDLCIKIVEFQKNNVIAYGIDYAGVWQEKTEFGFNQPIKLTPAEWQKRLIQHAVKIGFVEGIVLKTEQIWNVLKFTRFEFKNETLRMYGIFEHAQEKIKYENDAFAEIYNKGKWAEIISKPEIKPEPEKTEKYVIYVSGRNTPNVTHYNFTEAEKEANRLAEKELRKTFICQVVMELTPSVKIETKKY